MINFSMSNHDVDVSTFEKEWTQLAKEICLVIYQNPEIQKFKKNLQENGFLNLEEKSAFINISDKIKYELIYHRYGPEGSPGYKRFNDAWKEWFRFKGVASLGDEGQRTNIGHIMFGSTPDPIEFLTRSEEEIIKNS